MFRIIAVAVVIGAGLTCTGAFAADSIRVRLEPTRYNAGAMGSAVLAPAADDKTAVSITVSRVPPYTARPVNLRAYVIEGTCASRNPGKKPIAFSRILASSVIEPGAMAAFTGPMTIADNVPIPFGKLRTAPFAVSVSLTGADGGHEIFCGDSRG